MMNTRATGNSPSLRTIYMKLVAVSAIWGGTFVAGRYLGAGVPPLLSATARFLLSSLSLLLYLLISRTPIVVPPIRQLLQLAMLGFFGIFAYNICFFYGLSHTTASRASLIVALNPAMIALASLCFFHERLQKRQFLGILLCIMGAGLVIVSRSKDSLAGTLTGDLIILGCVVSWVVYSVFARDVSKNLGPLLTVSYSIWFGTLMLCIACAFIVQEPFFASLLALSSAQWMSIAYLGFIGSAVAYIWYYDAIGYIGATRSGAFIALNPIIAVLFGALLFKESLTPLTCFGGAAAVLGIYLCNSIKAT